MLICLTAVTDCRFIVDPNKIYYPHKETKVEEVLKKWSEENKPLSEDQKEEDTVTDSAEDDTKLQRYCSEKGGTMITDAENNKSGD